LRNSDWQSPWHAQQYRECKELPAVRRLTTVILLLCGTAAGAAPAAEADAPPVLRKPPRAVQMLVPGFLWIDAEDFRDYGGWTLDTQFVHLMGSGYLIAAGMGQPVADATTDLDLPAAGKYRLWVRARNWLKQHSPGRFRVAVGPHESSGVFGAADRDDWFWQPGGDLDLPKGKLTLRLTDLTGAYGRCDALLLTSDLTYVPPNEAELLRKERGRLAGLSLEAKSAGQFDVVVVGAGAAGSCAALAAARLGAKTALVQNRPVLGGNASIELGVPINGAGSLHPNARESGIIEEAGRLRARHGLHKMSEPFRLLAAEEKNLAVFTNHHVFAAEMRSPTAIRAVRAVDTLTGAVSVFEGKLFVDCTGDGWVGHYAGAQYRFGREGRDEFHESFAPEKPDRITMSGCIMGELSLSYRAVNVGRPSPYAPPPWAAQLPPAELIGRNPRGLATGEWWLERQGTIDGIAEAERSRDELIRITFGYWNYLKNAWPEREKTANFALSYVPIVEAKRETRRLVGDYLLTQNDTQQGVMFPDRVSYGGWPLDVHHPEGIYSGKQGPFWSNAHVPIYSIPFRCLYSANIENLLFAGRNMSVTHVALGTVRVQGTLAALGQAAGTGAALCIRKGCTPRALGRDHIADLQQTLLKHDQYIPGLKNDDPADLARGAVATASSFATGELFERKNVAREKGHPLNMPRAMMFPRGKTERLDSIYLLLRSELAKPVEATLAVREAATAGDFSSEKDLATATATVPPGRETFVEFPVNCEPQLPYFWLTLPKAEGVSWSLMTSAPAGAMRAYGGGQGRKWTVVEGQYYASYTRPALLIPGDFAPANVVNGVTRFTDGRPNQWASDPGQPLPQWIELALPQPRRINVAYLTFDTDMNAPLHTAPLPRQCVRDYELSYHDGRQWRSLANVTENFQRRRVHRFETVTAEKVRLTVSATNGDPSARVYEIRLYEE
jgi:hypothetical protein